MIIIIVAHSAYDVLFQCSFASLAVVDKTSLVTIFSVQLVGGLASDFASSVTTSNSLYHVLCYATLGVATLYSSLFVSSDVWR